MIGQPVQSVRQGGVEYGVFQAGPQLLEVGWRFLKVSGAGWRLAGYLAANGKTWQALSCDQQVIGPAETITDGLHAVIQWNLPSSAQDGSAP